MAIPKNTNIIPITIIIIDNIFSMVKNSLSFEDVVVTIGVLWVLVLVGAILVSTELLLVAIELDSILSLELKFILIDEAFTQGIKRRMSSINKTKALEIFLIICSPPLIYINICINDIQKKYKCPYQIRKYLDYGLKHLNIW